MEATGGARPSGRTPKTRPPEGDPGRSRFPRHAGAAIASISVHAPTEYPPWGRLIDGGALPACRGSGTPPTAGRPASTPTPRRGADLGAKHVLCALSVSGGVSRRDLTVG